MMTHDFNSDLPFSSPSLISPHHSSLMTKAHFHRFRPTLPPTLGSSKPSPSSSSSSSSTPNLGDANCMEQLLIHCAVAIENNDATPAQQILWVLNNIAPPDGDSNQRLTCAFLRALILRAARSGTCKMITPSNIIVNINPQLAITPHTFSLLELAHFVDLTPWHRFGFTAANSIILHSVGIHPIVHIIDLSVTRCMQIPTLIDSLATRFHTTSACTPPLLLRLTVAAITEQVPPVFDYLDYEDLGIRLINFARSRNITLEFKAVPATPSDGFSSVLEEVRQQQLHHQQQQIQQPITIVNCQMTLHYLQPDEHVVSASMRTMFLQGMKRLAPDLVVIVEEDADFTATDLVTRLRSVFNYLWIPFDTVDTFLPRGSKQREWYEADVCWKIENVIAHEGPARVERLEPRGQWAHRMADAGFRGVDFTEEAAVEVKGMLEEHAAGWGSKKEDQDLVLTWKGHNVVFASAWVPVF